MVFASQGYKQLLFYSTIFHHNLYVIFFAHIHLKKMSNIQHVQQQQYCIR